ncbi:MAG TPA: FtsX-like permease family protein [Mycobacteriales bacterium]|nr:FtsX-like permease family protein [Mycobacteriales bacterium]
MTSTLTDRPVAARPDNSRAARRAVTRWAWRLFRREWQRQLLIIGLLVVALAAIIVGLGTATNAAGLKPDPTFGTANTILTLQGSDPTLSADLADITREFGTVDVIAHQSVPIPGSIASVDLRAERPTAAYGRPTLRLDHGRFPTAAGEVAVTSSVAKTFNLSIGSSWRALGRTYRVVGLVENPLNLLDEFAMVAPGQANPPQSVSILVDASRAQVQDFRLPGGRGLDISSRGGAGKAASAAIVLILGTLGLLFVGLLAMAGFTVLAQRRMRALGMLGAVGASDRQLRRVMLANGAAVGATSAILGAAVGIAAWFALAPALQSLINQRIDRFDLPWWAIAAAMLLALVTAIGAAWWPARAVARVSVISALSGRVPRPQPAHRFAAAGATLVAIGVVLLAFGSHDHRAAFIIGGTLATPVGMVLLAPIALTAMGATAGRTPVPVRLAVRDLARFRARSGAALSAITLAVGIAATISIAAAAARPAASAGNLPRNQLVVYLSRSEPGNAQVPVLSTGQLSTATAQVHRLAAAIGASVLPLAQARARNGGEVYVQPATGSGGSSRVSVGPAGPGGTNGQPNSYLTASLASVTTNNRGGISVSAMDTLYVATPAVLEHFGLPAALAGSSADVLTGRPDALGLQVFDPARQNPTQSYGLAHPAITRLHGLPAYTSAPSALITSHAMNLLGMRPAPAGWLVQTPHALSAAQIAAAQHAAAAAGLYVERRDSKHSLAETQTWATLAGLLLALGVLAMTVGLIRSETARDLRTLAANGAGAAARRTVTAATAAALALLGALLGTAGAYAALLAWYRSNLTPLGRVPVLDLVILLVGLPAAGGLAAWLVAGREPAGLGRTALE